MIVIFKSTGHVGYVIKEESGKLHVRLRGGHTIIAPPNYFSGYQDETKT